MPKSSPLLFSLNGENYSETILPSKAKNVLESDWLSLDENKLSQQKNPEKKIVPGRMLLDTFSDKE